MKRWWALGMCLWAPLAQAATVYQCQDARGHVVFSDVACSPHAVVREVEGPPAMGVGTDFSGGISPGRMNADYQDILRRQHNDRVDNAIDGWQTARQAAQEAYSSRMQYLNHLGWEPNTVAGAVYGMEVQRQKQEAKQDFQHATDQADAHIRDLQQQRQ